MTRLRLLAFRDLARIAEKAGFHQVRREGSHNTFRHDDGRIIVIPDHGSQVIVRPLLKKILRDMGLSNEDYNRIIDEV
ncbi:MAG: type II toxin-antitoxin system HicA family toxin [Nitrospirae bacterium]|nr:type II toxin-antitoxin system HicA family toxin [Nitrospirota bacterium]